MISLAEKNEPLAKSVRIDADRIHLTLIDGREMLIPCRLYPTLHAASPADRENITILGDGEMILWESLDFLVPTQGLIEGHPQIKPRPAALKKWSATTPPKPSTESPRGRCHVMPREDGWSVVWVPQAKQDKRFSTKKEAVSYARQLLKQKKSAHLTIHRKDGSVEA